MGHRIENLEQFAIDVILGRRRGFRAAILRGILYAFSFLYERIVQFRLFLYRKRIFRERTLGCLVISIGNLTVGGTGKTPIVEKLRAPCKRAVAASPFSAADTRACIRRSELYWIACSREMSILRASFPMGNRCCSIRSRPATSPTCSRTT